MSHYVVDYHTKETLYSASEEIQKEWKERGPGVHFLTRPIAGCPHKVIVVDDEKPTTKVKKAEPPQVVTGEVIVRPDSVGPTDLGHPTNTGEYVNKVVRIQMRDPHAFISSKDEKIRMLIPLGMITKKFRRGEKEAYFQAIIKPRTNVLEIGERAKASMW